MADARIGTQTPLKILSTAARATAGLAAELCRHVAFPSVLTLEGDLGTGKTEFARGFIRGALVNAGQIGAADENVPSPTFTLVQIYDLQPDDDRSTSRQIWHFDLYRLTSPDEAVELAIDDAFATAISLIEWPDRLGRRLPDTRLTIDFSYAAGAASEQSRVINISPHGDWIRRFSDIRASIITICDKVEGLETIE